MRAILPRAARASAASTIPDSPGDVRRHGPGEHQPRPSSAPSSSATRCSIRWCAPQRRRAPWRIGSARLPCRWSVTRQVATSAAGVRNAANGLAMYILIGGGGQVGYYLAKELIEQGHEVLLLEKDSRRTPSRRRSWELRWCAATPVRRACCDEIGAEQRGPGDRCDGRRRGQSGDLPGRQGALHGALADHRAREQSRATKQAVPQVRAST